MAKLIFYALAICSQAWLIGSFKILLSFPFPGKSHDILGEGFVRILLKAGHEVTYITPYPKKDTRNLRYIDVSANLEIFSFTQVVNLTAIIDKTADQVTIGRLKDITNLMNTTFTSKQMQDLINDPNEKFDLVIVDWIVNTMYVGLAAVFNCPFIWMSTNSPHWAVTKLIDERLNPSYNPDMLSLNIPPLSFFQRIRELCSQVVWTIVEITIILPIEKQYYYDSYGPVLRKKGRILPAYEEMVHRGSLMFGNSDVSTGRSMTLPDNYKHIAGYHIDPEVKPLPESLNSIIENATEGVVYFSLGSNAKSKDLPDEIKQKLIKMFGSLKYTVLWKFEEQLSDLPKNVHILQWAPQLSILSHPNCKVFITHGGLLSTIEAINFGVPIIGIPVFGDQFVNIEAAYKKGFALKVDLSYDIADKLKNAIEEIINDPKYKQKITDLNFIFHDRPVTPAKEVAHWVNHVIRTKGAPHLRSLAVMMPWYQKYYIDFLALVLALAYVFIKVVKWLCCSRKNILEDKKYL